MTDTEFVDWLFSEQVTEDAKPMLRLSAEGIIDVALKQKGPMTYSELLSYVKQHDNLITYENPHNVFDWPLGRLQHVCRRFELPSLSSGVRLQSGEWTEGFLNTYNEVYGHSYKPEDLDVCAVIEFNKCMDTPSIKWRELKRWLNRYV